MLRLASILLALFMPLTSGAQSTPPVARLGVLANLPPPPAPVSVDFLRAFREGLKEAGFVEGSNLALEIRWEPDVGKLPGHAAALVDAKVDAIVTFTTRPPGPRATPPARSRSCSRW